MNSVLVLFGVMMAIMLPICMIISVSEYFKNKKATIAQLGELKKELHLNSTADLHAEVESLKERIVVLERIVTDRGYEVERKIGNL